MCTLNIFMLLFNNTTGKVHPLAEGATEQMANVRSWINPQFEMLVLNSLLTPIILIFHHEKV